nr:MAG TPA: hypothetical protein [Caudoviricetes sp.]
MIISTANSPLGTKLSQRLSSAPRCFLYLFECVCHLL